MTPAVPTLAPLALAGFLPLSALALEADADLETCQRWHERIEHYTRLRRAGGSSLQMERWRQARKRYEEQFRDARCHRWGRKLRDWQAFARAGRAPECPGPGPEPRGDGSRSIRLNRRSDQAERAPCSQPRQR